MQIFDAPKAPDSLRLPTLLGLLVVVFSVLGFIIWAMYTPLDSAVIAQGVVKVGSEKKQVQHLEGGIVKSLLMTEGDYVEKGQTLLTLDETFAGADHAMLSNQLQELLIRQTLLVAQRDNLETLEFPKELNFQPKIQVQFDLLLLLHQ